ncbi:hypothetical protein [Lyngbya aestuarii]|uniref:hypothetical protein n=1 Tax=Lyngbya aestuarii TaxID=118322 RepID=UPI00403E1307
MRRLNNRAFQILSQELKKCSTDNDPLSRAELQIVQKRLEKLRLEEGSPASGEELREMVVDIFPNFSEQVLKEAATANQPPGLWSKLKWAAVIVTSSAGTLWLLNLPYPMIRWPVAKAAPILLLPSYVSMDYNYRQAIINVEQADQLVNQPTSPADFEIGLERVKQAQKHLDALPVWFLGYWPKYTFWFGWQFTVDEFKSARATVGRMEAQLFQENNAYTQLTQAEQAIKTAKQQYQQAQTTEEREQAIATWQTSLDQIELVPQETLAGQTARTQLSAYQRDFQQVASLAAAKEFALQAEKAAQKLPKTTAEWQQVANLWQEAISQLKQIPRQDPSYLEAQKLFATYQSKLENVQGQQANVVGTRTANLIQSAQSFAWEAAKAGQNPPHAEEKWQQIEQLWQQSLERLEDIQPEDSGYPEAQKLLAKYQTNLGQIQSLRQAEANSVKAFEQAQSEIQSLLASISTDANSFNPNLIISQLQGIINQLEKVQTGTTVYPKAQELLLSAQNKLKQIQSQK